MNRAQLEELLYQALETEIGGVRLYEAAIPAAQNAKLRKEWEQYLSESRHHEQVLRGLLGKFGISPETETPGREVVRHLGETLLESIKGASEMSPAQQQIVAAEAILQAELKDHLNWSLLAKVAAEMKGRDAEWLTDACDSIESQEDRHLYHNKGWVRELWAESLGIPAVLPPPEEKMNVSSAIGAATAEQSRRLM
ncbi:MAG: hypothetical protein ACYCQK_00030 [Acidiferrobacteraceae bacterium]